MKYKATETPMAKVQNFVLSEGTNAWVIYF